MSDAGKRPGPVTGEHVGAHDGARIGRNLTREDVCRHLMSRSGCSRKQVEAFLDVVIPAGRCLPLDGGTDGCEQDVALRKFLDEISRGMAIDAASQSSGSSGQQSRRQASCLATDPNMVERSVRDLLVRAADVDGPGGILALRMRARALLRSLPMLQAAGKAKARCGS